MAEVTLLKGRYVTIPGYEVVRKGVATETLKAGEAVVQSAAGFSKAPANALDVHAVAIQDYYAGQDDCSFMIHGEMEGFSGLTPGAALHASTTVAGGWADAGASGSIARARAVSPTRISFTSL